MLFNCSNIQQSTFPHQPKAGDSPFLSRTGNVLQAFHLSAFACFPFYKRIFQYLTISPWHMFVYKGRQKYVSFCHKSKQFHFLAKEILALRFPSLEREGDHLLVRWWKVESSMFGWRNGINMLPIITQNGHTIHAIFDFLLIDHTTLCSNIWQSTSPASNSLMSYIWLAGRL